MSPPAKAGYAAFETALGWCGVAWGPRGLRALQLPEKERPALLTRLAARFPDLAEAAPPRPIRTVLAHVAKALTRAGGLSDLPWPAAFDGLLDWTGVPPFHRRVYDAACRIPRGETLSYGALAAAVGSPGAARAVGQAMQRNPFPLLVPCHRVLAAGGKLGGFTAPGGATTKRALLALEKAAATTPESSDDARRLGRGGARPLDAHAEATAHLARVDPVLGQLIAEIGPCTMGLKETTQVFAALAEAVIYQQLHGKAAASIFGRLAALFPGKDGLTAAAFLRLEQQVVRAAGLSRGKLAALEDLARKTVAGELPLWEELPALDDEEIIARLTKVRGIGRWTVEMLLMFRLGRPDVLPVDDFGVRRGFTLAFRKRKPVTPRELARHGTRWAPHRSVASWYLWRAAERGTVATRPARAKSNGLSPSRRPPAARRARPRPGRPAPP